MKLIILTKEAFTSIVGGANDIGTTMGNLWCRW